MANLLAVKPLSVLEEEGNEQGGNRLKRSLGAVHLLTLGIGAIIGAGIFVLTGQAAARHAWPAIALSFVLAGSTCAFAGLCYAEFASVIPIAGSAYTYNYATLGEFVAWIIGWHLILEYAFGAATVASGWSGYFVSLLQQMHIQLPPQFTTTYGNTLYLSGSRWQEAASMPSNINLSGLPHINGVSNVVALICILLVTAILIVGIKESANLSSVIVFVKLAIVGIFLVLGIGHLLHHPESIQANWHPFIPPRDASGSFGFNGIAAGAASVFFVYIGFNAVSTAAQEARNPQRDMPIGIIGPMEASTALYIVVSLVLTGLVKYKSLNVADPVAVGIDVTGVSWVSFLVKAGAVFGLATVMLGMLLGQSRVLYSMSKDSLLPPWASVIHPKFRALWISTALVGSIVAFVPALLPIDMLSQLVNMGTLLAITIVCAGVWILRRRDPDLPRPFHTPLVSLVPILGIGSAFYLMSKLPWLTWGVLVIWVAIELVIYFSYSVKHSKVKR